MITSVIIFVVVVVVVREIARGRLKVQPENSAPLAEWPAAAAFQAPSPTL